MCFPTITRIHEEIKSREKYYLPFHQFKSVISGPWQNAEVCRSHCRSNVQRFLLSLWQFFILTTYCRGKLKNSVLISPRHFIADLLSTWILKAVKYAWEIRTLILKKSTKNEKNRYILVKQNCLRTEDQSEIPMIDSHGYMVTKWDPHDRFHGYISYKVRFPW